MKNTIEILWNTRRQISSLTESLEIGRANMLEIGELARSATHLLGARRPIRLEVCVAGSSPRWAERAHWKKSLRPKDEM